jgi:N-acetylneuraminic acid mutarotase
MKTKSRTSGHILRSAAYAAILSCLIVGFSSAFNLPGKWPGLSRLILSGGKKAPTQTKTLTFAERVAYQRAIEEVYWRHRTWPAANGAEKPSLDKVMSQAQIEKKVAKCLRNSQVLENYWQKPITAEQLQAEMDRMARHSKRPEVLRELFTALGNDPYIIAECLARPALADRLARNLYAHDQRFHGALKQRAEADLAAHGSVKQMKQTSGQYSEIEWVKSDDESGTMRGGEETNVVATPLRGVGKNAPPAFAEATAARQAGGYSEHQDAPNAVKLTDTAWQDNVQKLAAAFGSAKPGRARPPGAPTSYNSSENSNTWDQIPIGKLSPLQEDDDHYYAIAVISKGKDLLKLATIAWLKQPFDSWRAQAERQMPSTMAAEVTADYRLPVVANSSPEYTDDTWSATALGTGAPEARFWHTAVWTGSEMIVWGGHNGSNPLNTGGRYDPATDSWTPTNTASAPYRRHLHIAVWTGSEMIVWGGYNGSTSSYLNTGGRYNPATDTWTPTSTTDAPEGRYNHIVVWTGSEMIVWGGHNGHHPLQTGGRYDPATDTWTPTSITSAPQARERHTTVWTGNEMIVWGGRNSSEDPVNTGGRYDPATDTWTPTSTSDTP